jgi:hypothetical protein
MRTRKIALLLLTVLATLAACMDSDPAANVASPPTRTPPPPPRYDVGEIGRFQACSAQPRRTLSARERCEIAAFRARCTVLDDCYVTCISSPDGFHMGGRCAHICTMGPHRGAPHPPELGRCDSLPGSSGIDVETARHGEHEAGAQ